MAAQGSILGNAVTRKEDPGLLTGSNEYVDDLDIDAAQIVFVRSTMAHAILLEVDISEAVNMPGVLAVYTAENLELTAVNQSEFMDPSMNRPPLASGRVRFVGDIIAAVVAESKSQGVDAAEQIIVDYDPLPANADIEAAVADDAPILWEGAENNVCFAIGNEYDGPDVTEGADVVVSERIVTQRLAGVPMEPNGCVAIPEGDSMTFYASTQAAHGLRDGLAPNLGLEPDNLESYRALGRRGIRSKSWSVHRIHTLRQSSPTAKPTGPLGRATRREYGFNGTGSGNGHERRDGCQQRWIHRGLKGQSRC